ncbi:MAG: response regulator transcription factor [Lewinella sp.]|nr:response regulator transcription factor [Lewinella sp.]
MATEILKVLLIEDHRSDTILIKRAVTKFFPTALFAVAQDQADFEEKIAWIQPDIVLSDYWLGSDTFTGRDALGFLKAQSSKTPFVFITGYFEDEPEQAAALLGAADAYLFKRNMMEELGLRMAEVLPAAFRR